MTGSWPYPSQTMSTDSNIICHFVDKDPDQPETSTWSYEIWDPELSELNSTELNVTVEPLTDCGQVEESYSQSPVAMKALLGIFLLVIILFTTLGNSVVCFIVHQKPAMRSAINLLLANMAFSNILLALLVMPIAFVTLLADLWILGDVMCRVEGFLQALFTAETVSMLLVISIDRYLIIVHKLDNLTPVRAWYLVGTTWILSACLSFPPTVGWGLYTSYDGWIMCVLQEHRNPADKAYVILYYVIVFVSPLIILFFSYCVIMKTIQQKSLRIHNHPDELSAAGAKLGLAIAVPQRLSVDLTFKMRAFKTIFILFLVYMVCWTPYGTAVTAWNIQHNMASNYIGGTVVMWIGYLNSALNPIIFCWRIKKFRDACSEIVPRSLQILPGCHGRVRRRINPGAMYEQSDSQPAPLQELQVQRYLSTQMCQTPV